MKVPFFAVTIILAIFFAMLLIKSFDYGHGWATALAAVGLLTFFILSVIALMYQMRKHDNAQHADH